MRCALLLLVCFGALVSVSAENNGTLFSLSKFEPETKQTRTINRNPNYAAWPSKNRILYYIDTSSYYSETEKQLIRDAARKVGDDSEGCVTFVETTERDPNYKIRVTPFDYNGGAQAYCNSHPGRALAWSGKNEQHIIITRGTHGCLDGTVARLMKYFTLSLGRRNEHQRGDRDRYIRVNPYNVLFPETYQLYSQADAHWCGFPYDYCSITHNQPWTYARPGTAAFVALSGAQYLPTDAQLSNQDCQLISIIYGCDQRRCRPYDCEGRRKPTPPPTTARPTLPPVTTPRATTPAPTTKAPVATTTPLRPTSAQPAQTTRAANVTAGSTTRAQPPATSAQTTRASAGSSTAAPQPATSGQPQTTRAPAGSTTGASQPGTSGQPQTTRVPAVSTTGAPQPGTSGQPQTTRIAAGSTTGAPQPATSGQPQTTRVPAGSTTAPQPVSSVQPQTTRVFVGSTTAAQALSSAQPILTSPVTVASTTQAPTVVTTPQNPVTSVEPVIITDSPAEDTETPEPDVTVPPMTDAPVPDVTDEPVSAMTDAPIPTLLPETETSPLVFTLVPTVAPSTAAPATTPPAQPSAAPTVASTSAPVVASSAAPSAAPTVASTAAPTVASTAAPTVASTAAPTVASTAAPTVASTAAPTVASTAAPTVASTAAPTVASTAAPTVASTAAPTVATTAARTVAPTVSPTNRCTMKQFCESAPDESSFLLGPFQTHQTYLLFNGDCVLEYVMDWDTPKLKVQLQPRPITQYFPPPGGPTAKPPITLAYTNIEPKRAFFYLNFMNQLESSTLQCASNPAVNTQAAKCPNPATSVEKVLSSVATSASSQYFLGDNEIYQYAVDSNQVNINLMDTKFQQVFQSTDGLLTGQTKIAEITAIQIVQDEDAKNLAVHPQMLAVFGVGVDNKTPYMQFVQMPLNGHPFVPLTSIIWIDEAQPLSQMLTGC